MIHAFLHSLELELGLLRQISDGGTGQGTGGAIELLIDTGHNLEQRGLS